jgi:hypothetical protein
MYAGCAEKPENEKGQSGQPRPLLWQGDYGTVSGARASGTFPGLQFKRKAYRKDSASIRRKHVLSLSLMSLQHTHVEK